VAGLAGAALLSVAWARPQAIAEPRIILLEADRPVQTKDAIVSRECKVGQQEDRARLWLEKPAARERGIASELNVKLTMPKGSSAHERHDI
jgi:hypothetical protein